MWHDPSDKLLHIEEYLVETRLIHVSFSTPYVYHPWLNQRSLVLSNAIHDPHLPVLSRDVIDVIDAQYKGIVVLHLDRRRILEPWVRWVLELILHLLTSVAYWCLQQHAGILDFSFKYPSLLLLDPHLMLEAPLLVELLLFEFAPNLLDPLLLQHLFHLCAHGTHLSVLIHLVLVEVRVRWKSRQDAKGVIFLSCQVH